MFLASRPVRPHGSFRRDSLAEPSIQFGVTDHTSNPAFSVFGTPQRRSFYIIKSLRAMKLSKIWKRQTRLAAVVCVEFAVVCGGCRPTVQDVEKIISPLPVGAT